MGSNMSKQVHLEVSNLNKNRPIIIDDGKHDTIAIFTLQKALITDVPRGTQTPKAIVRNSLANFGSALAANQEN